MKFIDTLKKIFRPIVDGLQNDKITLIEKMKKLYSFLETEYSYAYSLETEFDQYPGGPKYYINKYTNLKAQREIEIVLNRNSSVIYFFLKRLKNNIEPSYSDNDNCFSFYEIDIYNGIDNYDRHNPYLPPDYEFNNVKVGLEILKSIPNVINGTDWLSREKLDEIYLEKKKGYKSGHFENWIFVTIKKTFEFLKTDFDFKIIYDYDKLRPFEQDLGGTLVYSNDNFVLGFSVDFRDQYFSLSILKTKEYDINTFWESAEKISEGTTIENDFSEAKKDLLLRLKNYSSLQIRLRRARSASDEVPCCTEPG